MFGMFGLFGKSFDPVKDIPDLSGKTILVTGGNTGLGKETIHQLLKHNPAQVFLAARTATKAQAAIDELTTLVPNAKLTFLPLDLSDFTSIAKAAETFKTQSERLDILINNAGIMAVPYSKTAQGYEVQFGTNHMGHALLTKLLLPTMLKTAQEGKDVRIVNLSSEGHQLAPRGTGILFDQSAAETTGTWSRYGSSKLANILFTRGLHSHHPSILSVSVHPGVINTDLFATTMRDNAVLRWGNWAVGKLVFGTVETGVRNSLWAATAQRSVVEGEYYYTPVGRASGGSGWARDQELVEKLWVWTEEELKKHGY